MWMKAMAFSFGTLVPPNVMVTPELGAPPVATGGLPPVLTVPLPPLPAVAIAPLPAVGTAPLPAAPGTPNPATAPDAVVLPVPPIDEVPPVAGGFVVAPPRGPKSPLWSTACWGCGCSATPQASASSTSTSATAEPRSVARLISKIDFIVHSLPIWPKSPSPQGRTVERAALAARNQPPRPRHLAAAQSAP